MIRCYRNDPCVEGGESILLDLYPIVKEIQTNHPKSFEILTSAPVTFQRIIMGQYVDIIIILYYGEPLY